MKQVLLLVLATVALAHGFIQCTPGLCKLICQSPVTPESCAGEGKEYREHSSMCGCCATCVDYLVEGARCGDTLAEDPKISVGATWPVQKHCHPTCSCTNHHCVC